MALTADQTARLAALDEILGSGEQRITVEGRTVEYNLTEIRKERDALRQLAVASRSGSRFRRVKLVQDDA